MSARTVPWAGVIGFIETPSVDGRVLDWVLWETPIPVVRRRARGGLMRRVGTVERLTADGCALRGEGSIEARFAGRELTGGIDVETSGGLGLGGAMAVDEEGRIHMGGAVLRFVVDDRPAWQGVRLTVAAAVNGRAGR